MQPPGRPRLCAASSVQERQTPGRRRTPRAPAHEHPQARSQHNTSTCRTAQAGLQCFTLVVAGHCHSRRLIHARAQIGGKSAHDWVLQHKVQLRSQYCTSTCMTEHVGLQKHSV